MSTKTRLIPACAGKTTRSTSGRPASSAHPHACGENEPRHVAAQPPQGSSPRVRGKRPRYERLGPMAGLIPACAGKTAVGGRAAAMWKAHLRVCGENVRFESAEEVARGSSPACAGKTATGCGGRGRGGIIPRVCGENWMLGAATAALQGASPRVQGKPAPAPRRVHPRGFIPACAGKTGPCRAGASRSRVHPRVCGENGRAELFVEGERGSSPRMRGKRPYAAEVRKILAAHPRACGENTVNVQWSVSPSGSSPRMRGKP